MNKNPGKHPFYYAFGPLLRTVAGFILTVLFVAGCRQQNDPVASFSESDILRDAVKHISFNLDNNSRIDGASKLTLEGTRSFDNNYYSYDASPDTILSDIPGLDRSDYFLENDDQALSIYMILAEPAPDTTIGIGYPVFIPFDDGTFPSFKADRFIARPVSATGRTIKKYDKSGKEYKGSPYIKWTVSYDSRGFPETWVLECIDPASGDKTDGCDFGLENDSLNASISKKTVTFAEDPRTYSDYFSTGYSYFDVSDNLLAQRIVSRSGNENNHSHTTACYASDGSTLSTDYCGLSDATINAAAKSVETIGLTALDDNGTSNYRLFKTYYDTSDNPFYRVVKTYRILHGDTYQISEYTEEEYTVNASGSATLAEKRRSTYTNHFPTEKVSETYIAGNLSDSTTYKYERDGQGRITDYLVIDSTGDSILHGVYTFDENGWLNRIRSYDFTGSTENDTPVCGENTDFDYTKDVYGNTTKTITNYCNGASYQTTPHEIVSQTYNSMGLLTSEKTYGISGSSAYITSRIDYEYDDVGCNTRIQYYDGEGSSMKAGSYIIKEYDNQYYLVSEKTYNGDGDLISDSTDENSDCTANSACYSVTTYAYQ